MREEDLGALWEHFVLNEIMARLQSREVFYWRDKRGHEVDFVLASRRKRPLAIECKWSAGSFDVANLRAFRQQHAEGDNVVVAHDVDRAPPLQTQFKRERACPNGRGVQQQKGHRTRKSAGVEGGRARPLTDSWASWLT
ncbi:MAG: hypothetical protein DMG26_08300 [Acidobacteria bacterium]|nr:MAG: hypothetical protein DMG26_08300 [Acidobacteriota bacterium]